MTWDLPLPSGTSDTGFAHELYIHTLPAVPCSACGDPIKRRTHRVTLRASWRDGWEHLCPKCWRTICEWAARFALRQLSLDDASS